MIRRATNADLPALADLWHQGWHEAHAAHVPAELTAMRSRDSFLTRLHSLPETFMLGPGHAPLGFCTIRTNEIYQFYVSPTARGTGTARALMGFGEVQIQKAGHEFALLEVIPQNPRAIAFYEKSGWCQQEVRTVMLDTLADPFPLPCLIMRKKFPADGSQL